jgi:hypothetical protein
MKSIVEVASTIVKAIQQAWERAGKPREFTIKILEEPETNFLGLTRKPAKIAFLFSEKALIYSGAENSREKDQEKIEGVNRTQQPQNRSHRSMGSSRSYDNNDTRDNRDSRYEKTEKNERTERRVPNRPLATHSSSSRREGERVDQGRSERERDVHSERGRRPDRRRPRPGSQDRRHNGPRRNNEPREDKRDEEKVHNKSAHSFSPEISNRPSQTELLHNPEPITSSPSSEVAGRMVSEKTPETSYVKTKPTVTASSESKSGRAIGTVYRSSHRSTRSNALTPDQKSADQRDEFKEDNSSSKEN